MAKNLVNKILPKGDVPDTVFSTFYVQVVQRLLSQSKWSLKQQKIILDKAILQLSKNKKS